MLKLGAIRAFEPPRVSDFLSKGLAPLKSLRYLYMHLPNAARSEEDYLDIASRANRRKERLFIDIVAKHEVTAQPTLLTFVRGLTLGAALG